MAYAVILPITLLGRTELALRLPAALAGAGTIFVVFWLGQLLFGRDEESGQATPWRGLLIGGVGAGLLAVSIGQTILGRTAFRNNLFVWLLCLCLALSWEGWRQRGSGGAWWRVALAGVCTGLLPHTYISGAFHAIPIPPVRLELSAAPSICNEGATAGGTTVAGSIGGCDRAGGCANSCLFCSASRRFFLSQQSACGLPA